MNTKFYVPFFTAQLLDKKSYPQVDCDMYYNALGKLITRDELIEKYKDDYTGIMEYCYAAPAYCEVIDWLAQKEIYIDVDRTGYLLFESGFMWHCYIWERDEDRGCMITRGCMTREQAINEAILKVLE